MEVATFLATLVGALSTALLGFIAFRLSRQAQQYVVERAIGDLQSAMAAFRAAHPEVMRLSSAWTQSSNGILYGRVDHPSADDVVRYYSYVDIGLEFCNTTLAAARGHRLTTEAFEGHYRPLVRHFLAENYPFVSTALPGPYLSRFIREELESAQHAGWDWTAKHRLLGGTSG